MAERRVQRPGRIALDVWLARFGSVFAWFFLVFWFLAAVLGLGDVLLDGKRDTVDIVMPFVALGLAALHGRLALSCRETKRLATDFRVYCAALAREQDKSLPELAAALNLPLGEVTEKIGEMCRRGYFNGYVDHRDKRLVFSDDDEPEGLRVASCPGCGAKTAVQPSGGVCRYCGAPLFVPASKP